MCTEIRHTTGRKRPTWIMQAMVFCMALLFAFFYSSSVRAEGGPGESSDLEIGGPGNAPGQLSGLCDIKFDDQNQLYTLEGGQFRDHVKSGNFRVEKFTNDGKYISQFSVWNDAWGEKNDPERFAVDSGGRVYITQPQAGFVQVFGPDGKLIANVPAPHVLAIATRKVDGADQAVAMASQGATLFGQAYTINPNGTAGAPITLDHPISGCSYMATDPKGDLYMVADIRQIYKFDPNGKVLMIIGGGTKIWPPPQDGSALFHTVCLDSKGNIYSVTWGNPGFVCKFDPDVTTVTQRVGQFYWYDAWGSGGNYTPYAIDKNDRLWVGALGEHKADRAHYRPCVLRVRSDFWDTATTHSTITLGLAATIDTTLPYNVTNTLDPVPLTFTVQPAIRRIHDMTVDYHIYDMYKNDEGKGSFDVPLQDGVAATHIINFTPPRWGWYTVECSMHQKDTPLMGVAINLGFTPEYNGMPVLTAGSSPGGWVDPIKTAFCGMGIVRINSGQGFDSIDKVITDCQKYGLTLLLQFENQNECKPDRVKEVVTRYKGRIKYYEIMNEPNFSMGPDAYIALIKADYAIIKAIDPQAKVMGPTICGVDLNWYSAFYKLGGKNYTDILSLHDYEGNEAIDPGHWFWKFAQLHKIMAQYGDADKPVWQTERAIGGVRAGNFQPGVQAARITLHQDILDQLGIPTNHDVIYYMNEGGYSQVPTYMWGTAGPFPSALAMRTRWALTHDLTYAGPISFGPNAWKYFIGNRYSDGGHSTMILRTIGGDAMPIILSVQGTRSLDVVDSFGNHQAVAVKNGKAELTLGVMPTYVLLTPGQKASVVPIDFGRNLALDATFTYDGVTKSDMSILNNGILERGYPNDPYGSYWSGDPKDFSAPLNIIFDQKRPVDRVLVYSARADNPYCYLIDYNVQAMVGDTWKTVDEVREPCPPSDLVNSGECNVTTWYNDESYSLATFPVVTTDKLRIIPVRSTWGFMPDETAVTAAGWKAGSPTLMLREVEVYGPGSPIEVNSHLDRPTTTSTFTREPVYATVTNRTDNAVNLTLQADVPQPWSITPAHQLVKVPARSSKTFTVALVAPVNIPTGPVTLGIAILDGNKQVDSNHLTFTVVGPVAVTPQGPVGLSSTDQPIGISIQNTSNRPVTGSATLEIKDLQAANARVQQLDSAFGPIAPGDAQPLTFNAHNVDLSTSSWLLTYTVVSNHLATTVTQQIAIRPWRIVGPFGPDFDQEYGPEKGELDFTQTYPVISAEKTAGWKLAPNNPGGYVDLIPQFQIHDNCSAYAAILVKSPTDRKALFSGGSDDGLKAWVNGKVVVSDNTSRGAAPGQDQTTVNLKEGWNTILLKITQGGGGWGFYCDLLTPDGQPMPDLTWGK